MDVLQPVILGVPGEKQSLSGKERVKFLSLHARRALALSAGRSGLRLDALEKDEQGVPLPSGGIFWSLSHKPRYTGGVVSTQPVGLDIEEIRDIHPGLYKKTASPEEWALGGGVGPSLFFRFWTAKEAVIKANGTGLRDLRKCRVEALEDEGAMVLRVHDRAWRVEQCFFDGHTAAVAYHHQTIQGPKIHWTIMKEELACILQVTAPSGK